MSRKRDDSQRLCRLMCGGCAPPSSAPRNMGFALVGYPSWRLLPSRYELAVVIESLGGALDRDAKLFEFSVKGGTREAKNLSAAPNVT
jgi:hypothetical protein